jgi:hypothetical protein
LLDDEEQIGDPAGDQRDGEVVVEPAAEELGHGAHDRLA